MKRILYFSFVLSLVLFSCKKNPEAHFSVNTVEPTVGEEVFFYNESNNANRFEWDFGDGYISNEENPSHFFTGSGGSFEVVLTAISKNGLEDKASITLDVKIPTLLEIEVREYYLEYLVGGASVYLFNSITDWDAATNETAQGYTDADGVVVFSNLDPFVYYVDVWEADHDNYALRDEDIGFVRTSEIIPNKINRFIAWVDTVNHGKGADRSSREFVIKKLERKISAKYQPDSGTGSDNWQDLYKRSIRVK